MMNRKLFLFSHDRRPTRCGSLGMSGLFDSAIGKKKLWYAWSYNKIIYLMHQPLPEPG